MTENVPILLAFLADDKLHQLTSVSAADLALFLPPPAAPAPAFPNEPLSCDTRCSCL